MAQANMQNRAGKIQHGGKRAGAGRKPRYGARMIHKSVRLPQDWIEQLCDEFGSFQKAIETLTSHHLAR